MNYYAIIRPFAAIALLRGTPQDLPASRLLLVITTIAYLGIGVVTYSLRFPINVAIGASLAEIVLVMALVSATLAAARQGQRATQTMTALIGTSAVMTFISLPAYSWLSDAHEAGTSGPDHTLVAFLLLGWSLAVVTHIMRHALSCQTWVAMGVAVGYSILSFVAMRSLMASMVV